jgi:hypothetical protein
VGRAPLAAPAVRQTPLTRQGRRVWLVLAKKVEFLLLQIGRKSFVFEKPCGAAKDKSPLFS